MLLAKLLRRFLRHGTIVMIGPDNRSEVIAATDEPRVTVRLTRRLTALKLLVAPNFYLGETYMNGELIIERGDLRDLLSMLLQSVDGNTEPTPLERVRIRVGPLLDQLFLIGSSRRAIRHVQSHYDRSEKLFEAFLDPNRQYSCAYFPSVRKSTDSPAETIATAQAAKMEHIAAKLRIGPAADASAPIRVLDIGSGWGGLAEFLSRSYPNLRITGITLSENQCRYSREKRLPGAEFHLRDYRDETGTYDRIVSVGMFEHVGESHFGTYFAQIENLLEPDGVALVHTIGRRGTPQPINIWIRRRIFPGAYLPSLSQLAAAIERTGLWILDCENLRIHYALTLRCWHERLIAIKDQLDEQFYRMWEFYLVSCEMAFRHQGLTVYQLLLGKKPDGAPLSRDFMYEEERRLRDLVGDAAAGKAA